MIPEINLLPKIERKFKWAKGLQILAAILFVLAILFFNWQSFLLSKDIAMLKEEEEYYTNVNQDLQESLNAIKQHKEAGLSESVQYLESLIYPVSPYLIEINQHLTPTMKLENYELIGTKVDITISTKSITDLAKYVEEITKSSYFLDVKVNDITDTLSNKSVYSNRFTLIINPYLLHNGGGGQ